MKTKTKGTVIHVSLPFELHDWSESLTFNQINDTLFVVGQYLNDNKDSLLTKKNMKLVESWLKKNDIDRFVQAKETSLTVMAAEQEREMFARSIMATSYKRPSSH